jgi:NAD+-dependent protein deacetylase SIR2
VLYNEYNPDEEAIGNVCKADVKARPDAVIVVGTSLKVPGTRRLVKELCQVTRSRRGGFTAWINIDPEPKGAEFKDCWDIVVRSKCDVVAKEVDLPPWNVTLGDNYHVSEEEASEIKRRWSNDGPSPHFEIQIPAKPKPVEDVQALLTPLPRPTIPPVIVKSKKKSQDPKPSAKKTKQAKLSFGARKTSDAKVTKPGKKAGSGKRGRPLKNIQPKTTVLDTFESGKNVQHDAVLKKGADLGKGDEAVENIKPESFAVPSLRLDRPEIVYSSMCKVSPLDMLSEVPSGNESDSTRPTTPQQTILETRETISPNSVPKDMRNLID